MKKKETFGFNNIDEIMGFAIKSEENANKFYRLWADKMDRDSIREFFLELAEEELKHKAFLINLTRGVTLTPSEEQIADLKISDYITDVETSGELNFQEALIIAMHREKEAFKLYNRLAEMTDDEKVKDTFKALAQEEAKHKLRLETIYDEEILTEN